MKSKFFNVNFVYFLTAVLFCLIRILSLVGAFNFMGVFGNYVVNLVIQIGIIFLLPLFLFSYLNKQKVKTTFKQCSYNKISGKEILISIALGLLVFLLNVIISPIIMLILSMIGYSPATTSSVSSGGFSVLSLFLSLFMTAFLPAVCEEFLHRGLLLSSYKQLGFKKAVIYSSLLFGLLHMNIEQFFLASIIGCLLATTTLFSKSIIPAMIIHFMNNGINVYLSFAKANNLPSYGLYNNFVELMFGGNIFTMLIFVLILLPLIVFLIGLLLKSLLKTNAQKSLGGFINKLTISEMRRETLGEIANENNNKSETEFLEMLNGKRPLSPTKIEIPYEILGFYMQPVAKQTSLEKTFLIASLILGSVITFFTLIWGII